MHPAEDAARLPVTIIAGFLGSGKTTLVNHILTSRQSAKAAVIVNEIGEIGIDAELIIAAADDMVELSNGCICCSLNSDLVDAAFRILQRPDKIDHLVVECTGVADPLPIVLTFLRSELRDLVRVDAVVTVADADSFSLDLFASEAAQNQLRHADTVLLNKCDLVDVERLESIEKKIRATKFGARILRTTRCRVPLPLILGVSASQPVAFRTEHSDHDHDHLANDRFETVSFETERPFAVDKLQRFLERLSDNVFRGKGILSIAESDRQYVFHLVGQRFTLDESQSPVPTKNRLVLIGLDLDSQKLRDELEACLVAAASH